MRLVEPQGDRYWEAWREGSTVHQVSGAGTKKLRATQKDFPDQDAAEKDLQARFRKKFREGYLYRPSEPGDGMWNLTLMVHVSGLYTGFLALDYSPQQGLIGIGRPDQAENQSSCDLVLLDSETGLQRAAVPLKAFDLWQVCFDPRGTAVYVRAEGKVARVDPATQQRTSIFATPPFTFVDFCLSRDGRRILGTDRSRLVVKDLDSGSLLLEIPLAEMRDHRQSRAAALSPSGNLAALCEDPGKIQLFDLATGERRTLTGDFPYVEQFLIHPSERQLVLREHSADMGLWVIDADTGAELEHLRFPVAPNGPQPQQRRRCWHADISGDGSLLAHGDGYDIAIHDWETGEEVARLRQDFAVRYHSSHFTFAGTNDTLLSRVDLGIVSLYRHTTGQA